jgi:hypothetical protein
VAEDMKMEDYILGKRETDRIITFTPLSLVIYKDKNTDKEG